MFKRVREAEAALTAQSAEVQSLTRELKVQEGLNEELRVKVDEREEVLVNRGRELDDTLVDLRAAGARIEQLGGENKVLLELSYQQTMEVAALQGRLDTSMQREADLNTQLADSKTRIKDLEGQIMKCKAINVAFGFQIQHLKDIKADMETARDEAEQRRRTGESRIVELGSEAEVLRKELQGVCSNLEQSDKTKAIVEGQLKLALIREKDLSDHICAYKREIDDSKAELSNIGEQHRLSRQELKGLRFEKEGLLNSRTILQSRLDSVTSGLEATMNEIRGLSTALQIAQDQVEERNRELERVRFESEASSVSFLEQIGALNAKVDSTYDELQSTQQSLSDKQQEHQKLATAYALLESQHEALVLKSKSDSTQASGEVERLATVIKEHEFRLQATTKAICGLESKLKMSNVTLEEKSKELEERAKDIMILRKERDILQRWLVDAQQGLANQIHERTKAEVAANTTPGRIKVQENELGKPCSHLVGPPVEGLEDLEVMQSEILQVRVEVETLKNQFEGPTVERDEAMKAKRGATEMQMTQLQDILACNHSLITEMRALRAQMKVKDEKAKECQRRAWTAEKSLQQAVEENLELRDAERIGGLEQTLSFRDAMIKDLQNQLAQAVAENADIRRALMGQGELEEAKSNGRKRVRMY